MFHLNISIFMKQAKLFAANSIKYFLCKAKTGFYLSLTHRTSSVLWHYKEYVYPFPHDSLLITWTFANMAFLSVLFPQAKHTNFF